MLKKVIGSFALALALAACSPQQDAHHTLAHVQHHNMVVHEYREHGSDSNDWIYWYVLYSNSSSPSTTSSTTTASTTPQYYYRSATPVTNFSTTPFTRVTGGALPKDVKEEVDKSEETAEHEMTANDEPADVAQTEAQDASAEAAAAAAGGAGGREEESENTQNESQSESTSSESTSGSDSGSSGGDSGGGGDGGGGGE